MRRTLAAAALAVMALALPAHTQQLGETPPALSAVKWFNTPPLALEKLQGKAILVEVFRTW